MSDMAASCNTSLHSESTAFLGALWARCAQSAPRKAVDSDWKVLKKDFDLYTTKHKFLIASHHI